jgi:hypothetical protein
MPFNGRGSSTYVGTGSGNSMVAGRRTRGHDISCLSVIPVNLLPLNVDIARVDDAARGDRGHRCR